MKNITAKVTRRMHQAAQTTHQSGCCSMCGTEQTGSQVGKTRAKHCWSSRLCSPPIKTGGKKPVFNKHTPALTYTFIYLSNMKHEAEQKVLLVNVSVQFPLLSLLILFSCVFPYLPSDYFYICRSFPDSPPFLPPSFSFPSLSISLITLVLYFRVGLLQS